MAETTKPAKMNYIQRLNQAINACRQLKRATVEKNAKMMRSYASFYYAKGVPQKQHAINMIDRTVSVWMPFLVGGLPKILIEPKLDMQLKPFSHTFQLALNQWMKQTKFATRTLEPAVHNSLFGSGIVKTGTHGADRKRLAGYLTIEGKPYAEVVDEYNYVFDITAKDREQYEFEGDEYFLPTEKAKEMYPKFADHISPDIKLYGEQHPKEIENPQKVRYDELRDHTIFIDIWLPNEKVILTILPPHKEYNKAIKVTEYKGSLNGPYDVLGYKYFSGSTIPIPPIYSLMELDTAINTLFTKAREQAERIKKIGVAGNEKDGTTGRDAIDGGMYQFTDAQAVKEVTLGGVVPEIYNFLAFSLNQFAEQGGLTGLDYRMRSKTLGQEQMLMANATRVLDMMSQKVHYFATSIAEKLAFEMWRNPTMQIGTIKKIAGLSMSTVYSQLAQEGNFTDYYFDVELFSMQRLSPEMKYQRIMQLLSQWILPTAQIGAAQGQMLNIKEITEKLANYMNLNTESWFLPSVPKNVGVNPYQPLGAKPGIGDTRFGGNEGSNLNNMLAQENAKVGKTTAE